MLAEPREAPPRVSIFRLREGNPGQMDLMTVYQGDAIPLFTKAIYEFEPDGGLRYCVAEPGRPRPWEFVTRPGDGHTLVSLKRRFILEWAGGSEIDATALLKPVRNPLDLSPPIITMPASPMLLPHYGSLRTKNSNIERLQIASLQKRNADAWPGYRRLTRRGRWVM